MYKDRLAGAVQINMKPQKVEEVIDFSEEEEEIVEITANDLSLDIQVDEPVAEESDLEYHGDNQENQDVNTASAQTLQPQFNLQKEITKCAINKKLNETDGITEKYSGI